VELTSGRCSRCIKGKRSCDLVVTTEDWEKLDKLRASLQSQVADLVDEEEDMESELVALEAKREAFESARRELLVKKKSLRQRRLMLKAEYGSLTKREKETMARELSSIDELSRLEEQEAASLSPTSGGPAVPDILSPPAGWLDEFPSDWSFSQLLDSGGGTASGGASSS